MYQAGRIVLLLQVWCFHNREGGDPAADIRDPEEEEEEVVVVDIYRLYQGIKEMY